MDTEGDVGNARLRAAMAAARLDVGAVAAATGVDPKTVQRWLAGRTPYARHRWAVSALVSEDETYLWPDATDTFTEKSYQDRFRAIWSHADQGEAMRQTQRALGPTLPGQLINIHHRATIAIERDGTARIEQSYISANVSYSPLMVLSRDIWFEHPVPAIRLRGRCDRLVPMKVELVRDFPNYKQLVCNFVKPIQPLEVVAFAYSYEANKMFRSDHFWDQRIVAPTRLLEVTITHDKGYRISSFVVSGEFQSGLTQDPDPDLQISQRDDEAVTIHWKKGFPEVNGLYRIRWAFDE